MSIPLAAAKVDCNPCINPLAHRRLKVAVVHDWLVVYAGAEKVLEQLLTIWPDADVYALVDFLPTEGKAFLRGRPVNTSFLQKLPWARSKYRSYLPLMPLAVEQFDLSSYDLIISSSHAVAKGVLTSGNQLHVSYVHSPMRYAWDMQHQYLRESNMVKGAKSFVARLILHYMRMWDHRTACSVDVMVANSRFIKRRIEKMYGCQAQVIYPPVDTKSFTLCREKEDFYLTVSRMVPYKMIPTIVEAFARMPHQKLVVVGEGPDFERVKAMAGPNIEVLGLASKEDVRRLMQKAKAFVFAAEEDFGITPVEAQACGTPVIAYGRGGALETVQGLGVSKYPTGLFFRDQTPQSIMAAVERFEAHADEFSADACRANAEGFSQEKFKAQIVDLVSESIESFGY